MSSDHLHQGTSSNNENGVREQTIELTVEQLQEENAKLRTALAAGQQDNALLNEIISTIGSTLKLDEVLRHLVDTVIRAVSSHSAFIYLYNSEKERLVLASAGEQYHHLVGKIELALGEGINGWSALNLQPVIIKDAAMEDPRFHYVSELEEEKFQSIITVPIVGKERNLIGVITTHAVAPHELTEQHQTFVSNTAALVASAIENAQLYENTQRKLRILTSLSVLSQTISSGIYLDDMLRSLAMLTVRIMEVDLCVIMLLDQPKGRLVVRASSSPLNERTMNVQAVDVDRSTWEKLREMNEASNSSGPSTRSLETSSYTLERLNPLKGSQFKTLLSTPLIAGTEQLGLMNCYAKKTWHYTSEDQTLFNTIANQVAIAIKNSHLVDMLAQKNLVKGFFDDLINGTYETEDLLRQRAHFLGCDLSKPHVVAILEITQLDRSPDGKFGMGHERPALTEEERLASHKKISGIVRRRIQDSYPGSVIHDYDYLLTCLINLSKDSNGTRLKSWWNDLSQHMLQEHAIHLSVGVGNICQNILDYRRGYSEASEALQMGQSLNRENSISYFNDLGVYRYLYKIARMDDLRDTYQDQVARIAGYDTRKGTDLLDTLEIYLECAGNLTRTSTRLFVHRNTLIQRLERLQSLCDIDLQERSNWLTLQVAIKVYKLRIHNG